MAVLSVQMESGEVVEDPSEDHLFMLFEDIDGGASDWMIVTRVPDQDNVYFQSAREDDGYIVEYRDGGPDRHFGAKVEDFRAAHALATKWAFEIDGWQSDVTWEKLEF